jgi:ABC-type transport system involved in multi-copper enzyme maturation permease subunit
MSARSFNLLALKALLLAELRLRSRRTGTLVAMLALVAVTWLMVVDPADGRALMVIDGARTAYTSSCLALGSALLAGLLFGLAGFYLVRGRMSEDIRSGAGAVLAATPVGNAVFLFGRWLGSVAYLCAMLLAFLATMLMLHAVRGEGPIQLTIYLQTFAVVLLPLVFFCASMALLFDAWAPLMGKGGDVLYFIFYTAQMGVAVARTGRRYCCSILQAWAHQSRCCRTWCTPRTWR